MIRNGLYYQYSPDYVDPVLIYVPAGPFTVDGIEYPDDSAQYCRRPMIELFDGDQQDDQYEDFSTQHWSLARGLPDRDVRDWLR